MKEVENLIEKYAKKIQNDLDEQRQDRQFSVAQEVSALANLIKAKADSDMAARYYKTNR